MKIKFQIYHFLLFSVAIKGFAQLPGGQISTLSHPVEVHLTKKVSFANRSFGITDDGGLKIFNTKAKSWIDFTDTIYSAGNTYRVTHFKALDLIALQSRLFVIADITTVDTIFDKIPSESVKHDVKRALLSYALWNGTFIAFDENNKAIIKAFPGANIIPEKQIKLWWSDDEVESLQIESQSFFARTKSEEERLQIFKKDGNKYSFSERDYSWE